MKRFIKSNFILTSFLISFSLHIFLIILISSFLFNDEGKILEKKIEYIPVEIRLYQDFHKSINSDFSQYKKEDKNKNVIVEDKITKNKDNFLKDKEEELIDNDANNEVKIDNEDNINTNILEKEDQISNENNSDSMQDYSNQNNDNQYGFSSKITDNNEFNLDYFIKNISNYSLNISYLFKYPSDALKLGITGTVKLKIAIGKEGKVIDVILLESSGSKILDNYTQKQAYLLLFKIPEKLNIQFPIWVTLKIVYMIKSNVTVSTE